MLKVGDRATLKEEYFGYPVGTKVIVKTADDQDSMAVDPEDIKGIPHLYLSSDMLEPLTSETVFKVGDKVKIKSSVKEPIYGLGAVTVKNEEGIVRAIYSDSIYIDFPSQKTWQADSSEIELSVPEKRFKIGDKVKISKSIPYYGIGDMYSHEDEVGRVYAVESNGHLSVNFSSMHTWRAAPTDVVLVSELVSPSHSTHPIKIETEKVMINGKNMRKIIKIEALNGDAVPKEYLNEYPFCFKSSNKTSLVYKLFSESTKLINVGDTYTEEDFQSLWKIILQCGERLTKINRELKVKNQWIGKETFTT